VRLPRALVSMAIVVVAALAVGAARHSDHPASMVRSPSGPRTLSIDTSPPATPVKLVFIHHSSGENWLGDDHGGLGIALRDNNYFVSDTNYGWGPPDLDVGSDTIGDHTDLGHWYNWFAGPHRTTYLTPLFAESEQHSSYSRRASDPGGPNRIVMFKSCFPNSNLDGQPSDPATVGSNPMRGEPSGSESYTVANAKGIYIDILATFATRQDTLFVVVTAPPLMAVNTDPTRAANARAFNTWLVTQWLSGYPYANVAVLDFYNVLTTNGGSWNVNDLGAVSGNHHRVRNGVVEHVTNQGGNTAAYPDGGGDDHPSPAGNRKATGELVPLLNVAYHRWQVGAAQPTPTPTATVPPAPTPTRTPTPRVTATPTARPTVPGTPRQVRRRLARVTPTPPAGLGCPGPEPALVTDLLVRQPPQPAEPAPRAPFRDPVFGRCVTRVSDRHHDLTDGDPSQGIKNEYSRVQSFNADDSLILLRGLAATWYVYDAATLLPVGQAAVDGTDPRWDATDPEVLYYAQDATLVGLEVRTGERWTVHDFAADFPGTTLAMVWTRYEGSPSRDGRLWGLVAQDEGWQARALLVYDQQADQVTATRDMRGLETPDSVSISPLGDWLVAFFEPCPAGTLGTGGTPCGLMVYDRTLAQARGLHRNAGHADIALDAAGREVLVFQDNDTDHIAMLDLATGALTNLFAIDFSFQATGFHVSGRALGRPGWVVISTHDADAASHTWLDDQVFLVETRAGGRVVRLAHTQSIVDATQEHDYWAEPHASANRDLTRILFTSNWRRSGTEQVETFEIRLPADWSTRLP
jgi:hypothetical protein